MKNQGKELEVRYPSLGTDAYKFLEDYAFEEILEKYQILGINEREKDNCGSR